MKTEEQRKSFAAYMRQWRIDNPEKAKVIDRKSYLINHDKKLAQSSAYYKINRAVISGKQKLKWAAKSLDERQSIARKCHESNPEARKTYSKKYYQENKERVKATVKTWCTNNRDRLNKRLRKWQKEYRIRNPQYRLQHSLYRRMRDAIKGQLAGKAYNKKHANRLLGCTVKELMQRLEGMFKEGMTWGNYSQYGWHIDHIKPCASFDLTDTEQVKQCFHFSNLQPLWWRENIVKGNRLVA